LGALAAIFLLLLIFLLAVSINSAQANPAITAQKNKPANSVINIAVVTNHFVMPAKITLLQKVAAHENIRVHGIFVEESGDLKTDWPQGYQLIILDTPRGNDRSQVMDLTQGALSGASTPWLAIGGGRPMGEHLERRMMQSLMGYYSAGGENNFRNMMKYINVSLTGGDIASVPAPVPLPATGYYHSAADHYFSDLNDYLNWGKNRWKPNAPVFAVAMSDSSISDGQMAFYDDLIQRIEQAGGIPLIFWFDRMDKQGILKKIAAAKPAMLMNTTHMLDGEARKAEFKSLNIPVVMGMTYRDGNIKQWREAAQGISARSSATLMTIPESWGMSDPLVLAAVEDGSIVPIPEQMELLTGRFIANTKLQKADHADIKVALMFWNSPGGEDNISASNLNVPRSIVNIMQALKDNGYKTDSSDEEKVIESAKTMLDGYYHLQDAPGIPDQLLAKGFAVTLPVKEYQQWLASLPPSVTEELNARWGTADSHPAVRTINGEPSFVIPAVKSQNFIWLPQPPRAGKVGESTHDLKEVPSHYYLAAYLYLRNNWHADAFIQLGTHGTQEWTPGKDRGLWAYDYPNLVVGNVPVLYPYIQDNIGEAMQAKRRGRAVTISHQTPSFAPSGFYDELRDIHDLMHQYLQLEAGAVKDKTFKQMLDLTLTNNLHTDIGWSEDRIQQQPDEFIPILHDHLHRLAKATIPIGLHTFGESPSTEQRASTIMQQLSKPYYQALAELKGFDSEEMFAVNFDELHNDPAYQYLLPYLNGEKKPEQAENVTLQTLMQQAVESEQSLRNNGEMESLLQGLNGRFVLAGPGGDPVRNPQTTSGTNLYALDPEKIPGKAAYESAAVTFKQLLADYRVQHDGESPDKLAFSLWSSETIRTLGLPESQILYALGVKPVWDKGGRVTHFEIIPAAQLGRPRMDVVVQATSVYRDQFDGFMTKLAIVIEQLAKLKEANNPIADNSAKIKEQLLQQGLSEQQAANYSSARIFSNPPGDYGSGVTSKAMDSTSWEDDSELADTFIRSQSHIYSAHDWGTAVEQLGLLQSQMKGVDAAVLSRSSNVHGLLSTDHPYEYLGGLSAVAKKVNGENPSLYISNSRRAEAEINRASEFLADELRVRYQNPQWIQSMQNEGYAGAVQMLKIVNNMFGWQAMDSHMIRDDQWQAMHETYVMDKRDLGLNEWFEKVHPDAQRQLVERMLEAVRKGYWDASEQTRQQLIERWDELRNTHDANKGADKTVEFIQAQAAGFGMNLQSLPTPSEQSSQDAAQNVQGQVLQEVKPTDTQAEDKHRWLIWLLLIAIMTAGAARQLLNRRQFSSTQATNP